MKVLVTGGAGYIGSHATRLLSRAGHDVWVFDNLSRGHREAVPAGRLVQGELVDRELLTRVMRDRRIDAVMHFAAFALVGESVADPALYYQNNVVSSLVAAGGDAGSRCATHRLFEHDGDVWRAGADSDHRS